MQKSIFSLLFAILVLSLFSACDPGVQYTQIIENQSDYTLHILPRDTVQVHGNFSPFDSIMASPGAEAQIVDYGSLGQVSQFEDCPFYSDSIRIRIEGSDSLQVKIAVHDPTTWTYRILDESFNGGGICECRLVITNTDIQ